MSRSALLVLAYAGASCLRHALPLYKAAGYDIYVHVDAKQDLQQYRTALGPMAESCFFVKPRRNIYWGGFTMLEAEVDLLRTAINANPSYNTYALVSDDTFPLWPVSKMRAALHNVDYDRISLRLLDENEPFTQRYKNFYYLDHNATSLLGRPIETSFVDRKLLDKLSEISQIQKIGKRKINLYYGSQWWILKSETARFFLKTFDNDYLLRKSFEFSAVPDEMYVHSVVASFRSLSDIRQGPMYVDWTRHPRPYVFHSIAEVPDDIRRQYPFVRKVGGSPEVLADAVKQLDDSEA